MPNKVKLVESDHVREKLVELVHNARMNALWHNAQKPDEYITDMLMDDGVTVQEWISVDERLPENDVMVIGYTPCDGFMFVGYYHEEKKYDWKLWRIITAMRSTKVMKKKVTHWLPLPQPPKGE